MGQVAKDSVEIGLVLQGGGALGAYEAGAITALLELMDAIATSGRTVRLTAVTGVSIGAINAACVVGARDRADSRARLSSLWSALSLELPKYWPDDVGPNLALFGVPGFYTPRPDVWNILGWTSIYDTTSMLGTLKQHVDFNALNSSSTAFVITAADVDSGELIRFRNHAHKDEPKTRIEPAHVMASGSLPPGFPATTIDRKHYWDGGIIDNTPLGDAIDAFSVSDNVERILIVMNLFRKSRKPPQNMNEVNDRLAELRYGNRLRQDSENAQTINELLQTIDALTAAVPEGLRDEQLKTRIERARRFKILDAITNIDLADSPAESGLPPGSADSNAFRDFSAAGIAHRREIGHRIAHDKLRKLFETRGFIPAPAGNRVASADGVAMGKV
jgi:predicted acylesterase/phospholipase RssA